MVTLAIACESGLDELEAMLTGPGMPRGLHSVTRAGGELRLEVEATPGAPLLVRAIVEIEARRLGRTRVRVLDPLGPALAAGVLAQAIGEPALDAQRIIETHVGALEGAR